MLRTLLKELLSRKKSAASARPVSPLRPGTVAIDAPALLRRGYQCLLQGDHAGAGEAAREVLAHEPRNFGAHVLIAQACAGAGDVPAAEAWAARLQALEPERADVHYVRGMIREQQGRLGEATEAYGRALEFDPAHAACLDRKGRVHDQLGEFEAALDCARQLVALDGENPDGHDKVGRMLRELGRLDDAAQSLRHALSLQPDHPAANCHLARTLIDQGRFDEAEPLLARVMSATPEYAEARWTLAVLNLLQGRFEAGWKYYDARDGAAGVAEGRYGLPQWDGRPLKDGSLLIYSEQGLGDQIMFASCFADTLQLAPSCDIECDPRLERLFRRSFPRMNVFGARAGVAPDALKRAAPTAVSQIAAGSLPGLFRSTWADFPQHKGYLIPDPAKVASWRERLQALGPGLKVGLAWTGGALKTRRRLRSIELAELRPLLETSAVHFVSLQYVQSEHEIAEFSARSGVEVHQWPEAIGDYDETAAMVAALDLVITVCTAVVHLAGALGKAVWVMVPAAPEWRYLASGPAMPWYPAARLFRQQRLGEWGSVIDRIAAELRGVAASARDRG